VNVKLTSGIAQPVALSLTGLPAGATHSFSLASGTPDFTSALKISTEAALPAETYTLTITGAGGGKVHSATVNLGVDVAKTASSISLSVNPASVAVGESASTAGTLSPGLATTIELIYQRPDGFEMTKHLTTSTSGTFSDTFKPEFGGLWTVKARWAGDKDRFGSESASASISVQAPESPWPFLAMIVVIAVVIVAAALIFSRRRKKVAGKGAVLKPGASYCVKCGTQNLEGSTFCQKCGERIVKH